jgi:hypothetical protein
MLIIGCDFHARYGQIAMAEDSTGETLLEPGAHTRMVCAPTRFQPLSATNAALPRISGRQFSQPPAIPQHPNHLQVIIDIRYQYAIIVS